MFDFEKNFVKKENIENSKIVDLVEEARFSLFEVNTLIYSIFSNNKDIFNNTSPLSKSLKKLNEINIKTEKSLKFPRFVISTLGTTSSGKSTFVNGLLGKKLAPTDNDELSAGTLRISFNEKYKNNSKISIFSKTETRFLENGTFEESDIDVYNKTMEIMTKYRDESKKETLPIPQINIETSFLIAKTPEYLGLDKTAVIEILDLPGLKSISDTENLTVIQDNVRSSFIILVLDYSQLFSIDNKKVLYKELKEIKMSIGSDKTMIFILNKVDLRNQDDKKLDESIEKTKREIKEHLSLDFLPDVVPFDSSFLSYINSVYFAYLNYGKENDISKIDDNYKNIIISNLKGCFTDNAKQLKILKSESNENRLIISKIEELTDNSQIPVFEEFNKFYKICRNKTGFNNLCIKIMDRTQTSLRELFLYPSLNKYLTEGETFLSLLINTINVSSIEDKNKLEKTRENIKNIDLKVKENIKNAKEDKINAVNINLSKIQSSSTTDFNEGLKNLDLSNIATLINNIINNVSENTIEIIQGFLVDEVIPDDDFKTELLQKHWSPEIIKEFINPYNLIRKELYNERKYIKTEREFEYELSNLEEEKKVKNIENNLNLVCEIMEKVIIHNIDLEMQRSIDNLKKQVKNWIQKQTLSIQKDIIQNISSIDKNIRLPSIKDKDYISNDYRGFNKDNFITISKSEKTKKEEIQTGVRIEKESYLEKEESEKIIHERRWYTLYLYQHEKKVPDIKYVTKYKYTNVPEYKTLTKKICTFNSIDNQAIEWQNTLASLKNELWNDILIILKELFKSALSSYEEMIYDVTNQITITLDNKKNEIKENEKETELKWKQILNSYEIALDKYKILSDLVKTKE